MPLAATLDLLQRARSGVTKINLATQLHPAFTAAVRQAIHDPEIGDPRRYLGEGRRAVAAVVADRLRLLGTADRA
jgi:fructose/tagatose bisphosphate aldolase